jgi:hypothetical protein
MSKEKMTLRITIDGDSADELFAVGPIDLRDHFLPKELNVKSSDVKSITFSQVTECDEDGWPTKRMEHRDNFRRDEL